MQTGFAVTAFLAIFLNLVLQEEIEDEANKVDDWERIRKGDNILKDEENV